MDIAAAVQSREAAEQRRADLDSRDREHGGMSETIADLIAEQQRAESMRGWQPYRPQTLPSEVREIVAEHEQSETRAERLAAAARRDCRRVELGRLWIDCRRAVARFAPAFRRDAAETLQSDALLLLLRWPSQGAAPDVLDLGGVDGTPRRRDWIETVERADGRLEQQLTRPAWRALHAAVKQAAETPAARALLADEEAPTDPMDIAAMVEQQQRDTDAATRLPDVEAPELVAELLELPLDAGRAIVARAYPAATRRDLAESWRISEQSVSNALQRGAAAVRAAFPDSADLLAALDAMAPSYWQRVETNAALALLALAEQPHDEQRRAAAAAAAADWRTIAGSLPAERRALLLAVLAASRRYGVAVERAERIAGSLPRLMRAEQRRGRVCAEIGARGAAPLRSAPSLPAAALPPNGRAERETRAARVWSYGLAARDDRAGRNVAAAEIVSRNGGDRRSAQRWHTRDPYPLNATSGGGSGTGRPRVKVPDKARRLAAIEQARLGAHGSIVESVRQS